MRSAKEEARAAAIRRTVDLLVSFGEALEAGTLTEEHLIVVDRASPKERMRSAEVALLAAAKLRSAEDFGTWLGRWHADRDNADGISQSSRQRAKRKVTTWPGDDGMFDLRATLPPADFDALKRTLYAIDEQLARAGKVDPNATWSQRLADALMEMVHLARSALAAPAASGGGESLRTAVVVLIDYDDLVLRLGHGVTVDGQPVDVHEVRRLAADAQIIPMVMSADGEVLDMGRARRYGADTQWLALIAEQGGCWREGCTTPVGALDTHHLHEYTDGGATDLKNLAVGCRTEHRHHHASGDTAEKIGGRIHITHTDGTVTVCPNRKDRTPPKPERASRST